MSAFREAVRVLQEHEFPIEPMCPHCGAVDLPRSSSGQMPSPTLEREQDGSYTCRECSTNFRLKEK